MTVKARVKVHKLQNGWYLKDPNDPLYEVVGDVRYYGERKMGNFVSSVRVDVIPLKDVKKDMDDDPCRIATFEIVNPKVDYVFWPDIEIVGYLDELRVAKETFVDDMGHPQYVPPIDSSWQPGIVVVVIQMEK